MTNVLSAVPVDAVVHESFEWVDSTPDTFIRATLDGCGSHQLSRDWPAALIF